MNLQELLALLTILFILSALVEKSTQIVRSYPRRFAFLCLLFSSYLTYSLGMLSWNYLLFRTSSFQLDKYLIQYQPQLFIYLLVCLTITTLLLVKIKKNQFKRISQAKKYLEKRYNKSLIILSMIYVVFSWLDGLNDTNRFLVSLFPILLVYALGLVTRRISTQHITWWHIGLYFGITSLLSLVIVSDLEQHIVFSFLFCFSVGTVFLYYPLVTLHHIEPIKIKWKDKDQVKRKIELRIFKRISKGDPTDSEAKKEREITLLSFTISILLCLFSGLDWSKVIKTASKITELEFDFNIPLDFSNSFFVFSESFESSPNLFSTFLLAFFLTFGSKFFHDLIDLVFQLKTGRKKLNESNDWDFSTHTALKEYLNKDDFERFELFLGEKFGSRSDIIYYESSLEDATVTLHTLSEIIVDQIVYFENILGRQVAIEVRQVSDSDEVVALANVFPNSEIANQRPEGKLKGVISGILVNPEDEEEKYIMTCYHAIWRKSYKWSFFSASKKQVVVSPYSGNQIGTIHYGFRNHKSDFALIKPDKNLNMNSENIHLGNKTGIRDLDVDDKSNQTKVNVISRSSPTKITGYVHDINKSALIRYPDNKKWRIEGLHIIKTTDNQPFSIPGDSGSLVQDIDGKVIGMIIAGDGKKVSFIMPIQKLITDFSLKLI